MGRYRSNPWSETDDLDLHHVDAPTDVDRPQAFMPPTSGFAQNGLPIFSWTEAAAQLTRNGNSWSAQLGQPTTVTYAFRSTAPGIMPDDTSGFSRFSAVQIAAAEEALRLWADVANISFARVGTGTTGDGAYSNSATILFGNYSSGAADASAFAYYPSNRAFDASQGDVWVNISLTENSTLTLGGFGRQTLAHEIGHAIGLSHPSNYDASDAIDPTYDNSASYWQDARMFTIMSYFGSANTGGSLNAFAAGPQLHDIAAAQRLYGVNTTTRTTDTVYGFNSNTGLTHFTIASASGSPVFAIWDAGGADTLDLSGYSTPSEIDLREEAFSSAGPGNGGVGVAVGNISIARGAIIENAIGGAGNDTIMGNSVANALQGGGGDDSLNGGAGADRMDGGDGNDVIYWDSSDQLDFVLGGAGTDILVLATSAAAPTSFNLVTHGFEAAERRLVDSANQAAWATQTDFFDSIWRLDRTIVTNDNSTWSVLDYDQTNSASWASIYQAYDALGRLDIDETHYDDSSRAVLDYDQASASNWLTTWASYTVSNALDTDVVTYDDNSHAVRDFDQANAFNWQVTWASYTPSGVLDIDVFTYDDGSTAVRDLDQANQYSWDTAWASYDSQGRLDTDVITYDDGSHAVRDLDQANQYSWAQMWWLYDNNGTLISFQQTNDDGSILGGG